MFHLGQDEPRQDDRHLVCAPKTKAGLVSQNLFTAYGEEQRGWMRRTCVWRVKTKEGKQSKGNKHPRMQQASHPFHPEKPCSIEDDKSKRAT